MPSINSAVGNNALNAVSDQLTVIHLLNKVPRESGGPSEPLPLNVLAGRPNMKLVQAIIAFQRANLPLRTPDGRVDPGGPTLQKLNQISGAAVDVVKEFSRKMIRAYAQSLVRSASVVLPSELRPYKVDTVDERDSTASYWAIWKQHRESVRAMTRGNANATAVEMYLNFVERNVEHGHLPSLPAGVVFGLAKTTPQAGYKTHIATVLRGGSTVHTAAGLSQAEEVIVLVGDMGVVKLGSDSSFIVLLDTQGAAAKVPASAVLVGGQLPQRLAELSGKSR